MLPLHLPPDQARLVVRALRTLALSDGEVEAHEDALIIAAAAALGVEGAPVEPITPAALASGLPDPTVRRRVIEAMEILALLDGRIDPAELGTLSAFCEALGVEDPRLGNLRQIAGGHLRMLQLDLLRRSPMAGMAKDAWDKGGLRGLWRYVGSPRGWTADPDLAWRFKQLGLLPAGTLGRVYWAHMTARRFPFPGESAGFPEELVRHDLVHVLSGYDTDVPGEGENAAFISGFLKRDPFSYVFMVAVHVHLDIEVFPDDPSQARGAFDPARAIRAYERGTRVRRDLYDLGWDYWRDFPRAIGEVRADLGIDPPARPDPV